MESNRHKLYSSVVGILVAIPVFIIQEPYYILPFLGVGYHLFFGNFSSTDKTRLLAFALLVILVLLSNIFGMFKGYLSISISSILYFLMTVFLLAFAHNVIHIESFLKWFLIASKSVALYVVFLFFSEALSNGYFHNVTTSEGRMWAAGYVLGWPNGFAIVTSIAAYLCLVRNQKIWSLFLIIVAMTTFSRMAMIFLIAIVFLQAYSMFRLKLLIPVFIGLMLYLVPFLYEIYIENEQTLYRIAKFSDRQIIYNNLLEIFSQNPFGIGNVGYGEISLGDIYESYHSTWLKVLIRYGFFGFILFFILVIPSARMKIFSFRSVLLAVLLILGMPQDFLLLPSIALIYSLIANSEDFFNESSQNFRPT